MGFVDHLRLSVRDVAASRAFYDPWLGPRPYDREPDRYAGFFLDPDGIKLEAIHAG